MPGWWWNFGVPSELGLWFVAGSGEVAARLGACGRLGARLGRGIGKNQSRWMEVFLSLVSFPLSLSWGYPSPAPDS